MRISFYASDKKELELKGQLRLAFALFDDFGTPESIGAYIERLAAPGNDLGQEEGRKEVLNQLIARIDKDLEEVYSSRTTLELYEGVKAGRYEL